MHFAFLTFYLSSNTIPYSIAMSNTKLHLYATHLNVNYEFDVMNFELKVASDWWNFMHSSDMEFELLLEQFSSKEN